MSSKYKGKSIREVSADWGSPETMEGTNIRYWLVYYKKVDRIFLVLKSTMLIESDKQGKVWGEEVPKPIMKWGKKGEVQESKNKPKNTLVVSRQRTSLNLKIPRRFRRSKKKKFSLNGKFETMKDVVIRDFYTAVMLQKKAETLPDLPDLDCDTAGHYENLKVIYLKNKHLGKKKTHEALDLYCHRILNLPK